MSPRRRPSRHYTSPSPTRAMWIAARARNALRRPIFISIVSVLTFATSLLALVVVPQQAKKAAAAMKPAATARPDTEPTVAALAEAERQVAAADSLMVATRVELNRLVSATAATTAADTSAGGAPLNAQTRNRRDSLANQVALLGRLISRSENAPLLGSYRALAQAAPMQGDVRVKQLLDSLVEIERERDSYSAVGGVDPMFVALTARANELGRDIETLADARRNAIRKDLAALAPPPPVVPVALAERPLPDTVARAKARDNARVVAAGVAGRLARERAELTKLDEREERARELANVGASPSALLAAALVFGAMLGFGVALLDEVRHPRIADAYEVERATGVRVLGVIRPVAHSPERGRRAAERAGPTYIDPGADGHQLIYQAIATAGTGTVMLTITGDSPPVSAIVAINFAAIASDEARATLVADTDGTASSVMAALRLRPGAGMNELARGTAMWGEITRTAQIGRDRTIDVVPSGDGTVPTSELRQLLERDASRLVRQYDAVVLVSSADQVSEGLAAALPIPDVLYCVRTGQTPIWQLKQAIEEIDRSGARTRGIVLWNAPDPSLAMLRAAEEIERAAIDAA
jgi:Mrp family chromosome partitioning ATPase